MIVERIKNFIQPARAERKMSDAHDDARLEEAERQVADLERRSNEAVRILTSRHVRNHYGEAIKQMIQGVN